MLIKDYGYEPLELICDKAFYVEHLARVLNGHEANCE